MQTVSLGPLARSGRAQHLPVRVRAGAERLAGLPLLREQRRDAERGLRQRVDGVVGELALGQRLLEQPALVGARRASQLQRQHGRAARPLRLQARRLRARRARLCARASKPPHQRVSKRVALCRALVSMHHRDCQVFVSDASSG